MGLTYRTLRDMEKEAKETPMWKSDRRLCLTADRKRVVPESHPDAAFLLVIEGGEIPEAEAIRLGLMKSEEVSKVDEKPAEKAAAKPADKARKPSANK